MKIKFNKIFLALILISVFFMAKKPIKAENAELVQVKHSDIWFYRYGAGINAASARYAEYYMNGKVVFCIEPGVQITTNHYIGNLASINSPWSEEQNLQIALIVYYGYSYPGHQTLRYKMATQFLIWKYLSPQNFEYYTEASGWGDYIDISYEENEIMKLINNHYVVSSFSDTTVNAKLGEEISLIDNNNVLSKFEVIKSDNYDTTIDGNVLKVKPKKPGNISVTLKMKSYTTEDAMVFIGDDGKSQKMGLFGLEDPVYFSLSLNVTAGKIKLKKVDSETNSTISQGQASLVGAKYQILDSDNNVVDTLIIDSNNTAISDYLPLGTYKIKEIASSTGYLVNDTIYTAELNSSEIKEVIVKENVIKGKVKLTKQDSETNSCTSLGQASLVGAKYQVLDWNNNIVDTLIIGNDCTSTSKDLPYGNYTVKEIEAPKGYSLDTNIYNVNINNHNQVIEVISKDEVIKGKIKIMKQDSETNSCTSLGQSSLIGAKYQILDSNNNVVDTIVIDSDCIGDSKDLPYGKYKIKEIEAPKGYELDTKIYEVNINSNAVVLDIISKEKVIKNFISILKQYDFVDGTTQFLNAEANVRFEIFYPNGRKYGEITTDKNGYATIEIPFGIWKFHQVNSNTGFEKIYDFYITIDENSEKEQYYNILNNKLSAYLQVVKVDSETGKNIAIANTAFKILNTDTNQYVSQFVGGKVLDTFYTDETGKMVTYLKLESGNYKLIEVSSPNGYLLDNSGLTFTIGDDTYYNYTTYGAFITVTYKNTPIKGQIEINKIGEDFIIENGDYTYINKPLSNVVFEIYANEDILSSDGNHLYYNKDDLVDTIITDSNGYAISKKIPLGKYYLIEVKTHDDYVLDTNKHYFELEQFDEKTPIVYKSYSNLNYLKKGKLEFTKVDISTSEPLPNTTIEIYTEDEQLVFTGITDKDGKIVIDNLKIGRYYILEKQSPIGYVLNTEKMYFEIKENGEIVKAIMSNKPITNDLEITKIDISTSEPLPNTIIEIYTENDELIFTGITDKDGKIVLKNLRYGKYYFMEKEAPIGYVLNDDKIYFEVLEDGKIIKSTLTNEKIKGKLEFTKVDISTSEPLPNTIIEIYTENDELIFTGITDKDGKIVIEELEYGKYYIVEKQALTEYVLNTEKMYFEIKENGEIVKSTMTNEKIKSLIKIHKVDENNNSLAGVTIGIYDIEDNLIYEGITDEFGYIEVELDYGKYYYKEIATIDGYIISEEKVEFEIVNNNETLEYTLVNNIEEIDVPNTERNRNIIFDVLLSSLFFIGIGLVIYAKKNIKK